MARAPFPKTRHVALSLGGRTEPASAQPAQAAVVGDAEALIIPLEIEEREPPGPSPAQQPAKGAKVAADAPARALSIDLSIPASAAERCADASGAPIDVRCPSSLEGRQHAARRAAAAVALGEAVLLDGLDRAYKLGPDGAGYCGSCGAALVEEMRDSYGHHIQPFDALAGLRPSKEPLPIRERPFGGLREAVRLAETVEAAKRTILRTRDEGRQKRQLEIPILGKVSGLGAPALLLAPHLDGLIFPLPSLEPAACLLPLLAARAALGNRPAIALAPASATAAQVRLLAALATACDVDLALEPGSARPAELQLALHRAWLSGMRDRLRPAPALADLAILVAPRADAWSAGLHLATASIAAAAIARLHLQVDAVLTLPVAGRIPLVIAGCGALSEEVAVAARRHVSEGSDVLLVGRCAIADDEGRPGEKLFPEAKAGLNRIGEGRVWALAPDEDPAPGPDLEAQIARAARELLGRGRAALTLSGRGSLLVRCYLDPERKLDVHLVNLDVRDLGAVPAQGLTLHLSGQVAGAGRSGYWFAADREQGTEGERIALNPAGFGVSTVLPRIGASALLTIPR